MSDPSDPNSSSNVPNTKATVPAITTPYSYLSTKKVVYIHSCTSLWGG